MKNNCIPAHNLSLNVFFDTLKRILHDNFRLSVCSAMLRKSSCMKVSFVRLCVFVLFVYVCPTLKASESLWDSLDEPIYQFIIAQHVLGALHQEKTPEVLSLVELKTVNKAMRDSINAVMKSKSFKQQITALMVAKMKAFSGENPQAPFIKGETRYYEGWKSDIDIRYVRFERKFLSNNEQLCAIARAFLGYKKALNKLAHKYVFSAKKVLESTIKVHQYEMECWSSDFTNPLSDETIDKLNNQYLIAPFKNDPLLYHNYSTTLLRNIYFFGEARNRQEFIACYDRMVADIDIQQFMDTRLFLMLSLPKHTRYVSYIPFKGDPLVLSSPAFSYVTSRIEKKYQEEL